MSASFGFRQRFRAGFLSRKRRSIARLLVDANPSPEGAARPGLLGPSRRARAARHGRRPALEFLEGRQLLSIAVSTFDDIVDDADGLTSLREAIVQAASVAGPDTVVLPHEIGGVEGTYTINLGELAISDADGLTIESDGGAATIDAGGNSRVFSIAAGSVVTLDGLVITGGSSPDTVTGSGGGVSNDGDLTVTDCTFLNNSAGFIGGGLYNSGSGTATVEDTLFEGNSSTYGGGFNNQGTTTVTGGSFLNNTASGNSGGLDNIGIAIVSAVLFEGNTAVSFGGGLHSFGGFDGFAGTTEIAGCTFRNNKADVGGGVHIDATTATIDGTTFDSNMATVTSIATPPRSRSASTTL